MIIELRTYLLTNKIASYTISNGSHFLTPDLKEWYDEGLQRAEVLERLLREGCTHLSTVTWNATTRPSETPETTQRMMELFGEIIDTFFLEEEMGEDLGELVELKSRIVQDVPFQV